PPAEIIGVASPLSGGTVTGGGVYPVGSTQQLTAKPTTSWKFTSWGDGNTTNPRTIVVNSGGRTYTAKFVETATIKAVASPLQGGSVTGGGTYVVGAKRQLTAVPSTSWKFTTWGNGSTANPRTITVKSGGGSYTAKFIETAVITGEASPPEGGSVTGGGTFPVGSTQKITAVPNTSWKFSSWANGSTANPRTITVPAGGATVTGNFVRLP
ncbi:MAG: hypothetical protein H0U43_09410, partial [Chthoniobacterales bacterium]|nr:hypothetical protein [Chthoniobacterales bacterium]